jgi:hypothetical protein
VLWISDAPLPIGARQAFRCKPPLHAYHLAEQLKQIEQFFQKARQMSARRQPEAPHKLLPSQMDAIRAEFPEGVRVKLARWPAPELLSDNRHLWHLSAMLSVRDMTLSEMIARSAQPDDVCHEFLSRLNEAGCVEKIVRPKAPPPSFHAPQVARKGMLSGLFERIRASLGLSPA